MYQERKRGTNRRMPRRGVLGVTTAALGAIAGCAGNTGNPDGATASVESTDTVSMTGSQFQPRNVHVDTGTTVTWRNEASFEHTVTSASDNWEKDTTVPAGEETTHTFEESGVYEVYCTLHGGSDLTGMSMKVGVGEATIESPVGGGDDGGGGGAYG